MSDFKLKLDVAESFARKLLSSAISDPKKSSAKGGVYLIRINNHISYIGLARNLHRRINSDHISGEKKNSTSSFRRSISKKYGIEHGAAMRSWVMEHCVFSFVEIEDRDMRHLVESLLISVLRGINLDLLNK